MSWVGSRMAGIPQIRPQKPLLLSIAGVETGQRVEITVDKRIAPNRTPALDCPMASRIMER